MTSFSYVRSTRRGFMFGAVAGIAAVRGVAFSQEATPVATTTATRTFIDDRGVEVAVPVDPQRIVVLDTPYLDLCLLLGITPVAGVSGRSVGDWDVLQDAIADGMTDLGSAAELDLELIFSLDPDLIIGGVFNLDRGHDLLEEKVSSFYGGQVNANFRQRLETVASILNRHDAWQVVDDAYVADMSAAASALPEDVRGASVTSLRFRSDEISLQTSTHFVGGVLETLGFDMVQGADEDDRIRTLSLEQIREVDTDLIFVVIDGEPAENAPWQEAQDNPLWQGLRAVQAGRAFTVDSLNWIELRGYSAAYSITADIQRLLG